MQDRSIQIKRLIYQSANRGCRENDLILKQFAAKYLAILGDDELENYAALLNESDVNIFNWITKREPVPEKFNNSLMTRLLNFKFTN